MASEGFSPVDATPRFPDEERAMPPKVREMVCKVVNSRWAVALGMLLLVAGVVTVAWSSQGQRGGPTDLEKVIGLVEGDPEVHIQTHECKYTQNVRVRREWRTLDAATRRKLLMRFGRLR